MNSRIEARAVLPAMAIAAALLSGCLSDDGEDPAFGHRLYVAHEGVLAAYDIATGEQQAGEVVDVTQPTDLQALEDGTLLVNLSGRNEVLVVDGKEMLEVKRIPSTLPGGTAVRPVHSYITPEYDGKRYWMTLNDGPQAGNTAAANSALLIDISTPADTASIRAVGEAGLGVGHHKASFSRSRPRVVITNLADTGKVLGVYDFSDPADFREVEAWSAGDLGIRGAATPHGCGTAAATGRGYCNATGSGDILSVDLDAEAPSVRRLPTGGAGGGYTKAHPGGRYVYSLQTSPREGDTTRPGAVCQVGQVVVIDAETDTVVNEVAVKYDGPDCDDSILGTEAATAGPGHLVVAGNTLFVQLASGFSDPNGAAAKHLVLDVSDPARPVQKASLDIGRSRSHHGEALSGDDAHFFVADNLDGTVTQIDAAGATVVKTLEVFSNPRTVATWGEQEGPSHQAGPLE